MQTEVVTDPDAIAAALKAFLPRQRHVGYEAGSLSPWLHPDLSKRGLPAVCLETKHVRAAMSAQRNKTDAANALGFKGRDKVQTWSLALARRSCRRKATVAVARKLAEIMHAMWTDGTCYVGDAAASTGENQARAARKDGKLLKALA